MQIIKTIDKDKYIHVSCYSLLNSNKFTNIRNIYKKLLYIDYSYNIDVWDNSSNIIFELHNYNTYIYFNKSTNELTYKGELLQIDVNLPLNCFKTKSNKILLLQSDYHKIVMNFHSGSFVKSGSFNSLVNISFPYKIFLFSPYESISIEQLESYIVSIMMFNKVNLLMDMLDIIYIYMANFHSKMLSPIVKHPTITNNPIIELALNEFDNPYNKFIKFFFNMTQIYYSYGKQSDIINEEDCNILLEQLIYTANLPDKVISTIRPDFYDYEDEDNFHQILENMNIVHLNMIFQIVK